MVTGGECGNCGHVFQDDDEIKESVRDLINAIKFKTNKTNYCIVFNELLGELKSAGDCDFLHDKAVTISDLLLNLAGFETEEDESESTITCESTIIGVYHNQGYSDKYSDGRTPVLMSPLLVATVEHPAPPTSFKLGHGTLKTIENAWDEFVKTEPETDTQFEQFLFDKYGFKSARVEGEPDISISV